MLCLADDGSKSKQNSAAFCDLASKISCAELLTHTMYFFLGGGYLLKVAISIRNF